MQNDIYVNNLKICKRLNVQFQQLPSIVCLFFCVGVNTVCYLYTFVYTTQYILKCTSIRKHITQLNIAFQNFKSINENVIDFFFIPVPNLYHLYRKISMRLVS